MKHLVSALSAIFAFSVCGCSSTAPPADKAPSDPDRSIDRLEAEYVNALQQGPYESPKCNNRRTPSRALIRKKAQNLAFRHPDHAPTRVINGVLAYEFDDPARATQHLDHALRVDGTNPEAAVLRSRIALEEGNTAFAIRVLEGQVQLRPDHSGLREAQASAFFMANDYVRAREALTAAEQLGAPAWRISYNRGLIDEESGDPEAAMGHYQQALAASPGCAQARDRLTALERTGVVAQQPQPVAEYYLPSETPVPAESPQASGSVPSAIAMPAYGSPPR